MKSFSCITICIFFLFVSIIGFTVSPAVSQTAQELFDTASKYAQQGSLEQAEETFRKVIQLDHSMAGPAYLNLAMAYAKNQNFTKAVEYYEKALQYKPDAMMIHINLANAYLSMGNLDKAVETFKKVTSIDPKAAWPYYNLGNLYLQNKNYPEAIVSFTRVTEMDPDKFRDIYQKLGYALQMAYNFSEALDAYKKDAEKNPGSYLVHYNMGICYYKLDDLDNAIKSYEKAIEISPENAEAITNLGLAFYHKDKYDLAAGAFNRALAFKPYLGEALFGMALICDKNKDYEQALTYAEKAIKSGMQISTQFIDRLKTNIDMQPSGKETSEPQG